MSRKRGLPSPSGNPSARIRIQSITLHRPRKPRVSWENSLIYSIHFTDQLADAGKYVGPVPVGEVEPVCSNSACVVSSVKDCDLQSA
jgi:hypothetical protein